MNEKQLSSIMAVVAGMQCAFVVLVNALDAKGACARDDIASSLLATAQSLPSDTNNRLEIETVLRQLSQLLATSDFGPETIRRILN